MWFYFLLAALLVLVILLYFMPIHTEVNIEKRNRDDNIKLYTRTGYGLVNIKVEIPFLKIYFKEGRPVVEYKAEIASPRTKKLFKSLDKLFSRTDMLKLQRNYQRSRRMILGILNYLRKKTEIDKLYLKLGIGTGDAAETGIAYGLAWMAVGNILAFTGSLLSVRKPVAVVVPYFDAVRLSIDFNCIISLRLGHIINAGIRALAAMISSKRAKIYNNHNIA